MRKQRKPYITEKRGKLYFRMIYRVDGKRRERYIPIDYPENSPEFDQEYWAIRAGTSDALHDAPLTSWDNLVAHYKASAAYKRLKDGTRRKYGAVLDALREKNGSKDVRRVTRSQVRAIHEKYADTPRKADHHIQVIRLLLNFAKNELEWIDVNPAEGIKLFGSQSEVQHWPEAAQKAFLRAAEALGDQHMIAALHLGVGTGQRPGDLLKMEWAHFDGEYMDVKQEKTSVRLTVFCPPALRAFLSDTPKRGAYIIAKNLRQPLSYSAAAKRFRDVRAEAGKVCDGLTMHGWRKTAVVSLAEAGCTDAEIQAVTGHKTAAMAAHYRKGASQKKLSRGAQNRR